MEKIKLRGRITASGQLEVDLPEGLPAVEVNVEIEIPISESLPKQPKRSLNGLLTDLGPAPSAEDIDEARREMWGNFPREDSEQENRSW